jgi:hypothetical protein
MALNGTRKPATTHNKTGTGLTRVTPVEVDRIRRQAYDIVRRTMPEVRDVLRGSRPWTNQQVRLFGMLLNKVMPDLHHSFNEHKHEHRQIHEMSVQELEAIVANSKAMPALEGEFVPEQAVNLAVPSASMSASMSASPLPAAAQPEDEDDDLPPDDPPEPKFDDYDSDLRQRRLRVTRKIDKLREKVRRHDRDFTPHEQKTLDLLLQERSRIPKLDPSRHRNPK